MFTVTYEIVTPESAENGDVESRGYVSTGEWHHDDPVSMGLREAIDLLGGVAYEANEWPVTSPRWLTNHEYGDDWSTGGRESRSMHIPDSVTDASRLRICKLLGLT